MEICAAIYLYPVTFLIPLSRWRRMRRASHEALNTGVVSQYHPVQQTEAVLLAYGFLTDSDHWFEHLRRFGQIFSVIVLF